MSNWMAGLEAVLSFQVLIFIVLGLLIGIVVGALPGISATVGVAVLLPFTFTLEPLTGMMLLLGIYGGAVYAGSIPAILIRAPGTPASAASVMDGHEMTKRGEASQALTISVIASCVGGLLGVVALGLFAPALAGFALSFGPAEYFMLAILALTVVASVAENNLIKGLLSGVLGFSIAMIGFDTIQAFPRFTFGTTDLAAGIQFIPVMIGLFAVSEAILQFENRQNISLTGSVISRFRPTFSWIKRLIPSSLLSSAIGFIVGVIPGTGGDIGSFVAYNESKRFARGEKHFGEGDPRGVSSAEAAKNAGTAGALVPMLTLGIPGDVTSAILIGAITVHGLRPGPALFTGSPDLVYGIFIGFFIAYLILLVIGLAGIKVWVKIIQAVPTQYLWPTVMVLSVIGAYALRASAFDVFVMLFFGVVGYFMIKGGFPVAPLIIGIILGPIAESGYRRTMLISGGSFDWLLQPIPLILLILTILSVAFSLLRTFGRSRR